MTVYYYGESSLYMYSENAKPRLYDKTAVRLYSYRMIALKVCIIPWRGQKNLNWTDLGGFIRADGMWCLYLFPVQIKCTWNRPPAELLRMQIY